jgi:quercetin dioxygenase-like cupin family protein
MPFIDTSLLKTGERLPGWRDRSFNTASMTFANYSFDAGSKIHEHSHPNEEVWTVLEGELEISIGADSMVAGPGVVAVVPPYTSHSVRAITDGRVIVTDCPVRIDPSGGRRAVVKVDFDSPPRFPGDRAENNASPTAAVSATAVTAGAIQIPFTLHNWGKTRAVVRELLIETKIAPALPPATTTEIPAGELPIYCMLEADERRAETISHSRLIPAELDQLMTGASILYVKGVILYDDDFGSRHHNTFCRVYDPASFEGKGGFETPEKPGYNYGT